MFGRATNVSVGESSSSDPYVTNARRLRRAPILNRSVRRRSVAANVIIHVGRSDVFRAHRRPDNNNDLARVGNKHGVRL